MGFRKTNYTLSGKGLHKVKNEIYNCAATLNFDRFDFAANLGRVSKSPLSLGTVPIQAKTSSQRTPLVSTVKQCLVFKGFFAFIVAVLHTLISTVVGGVEQSDVMQSCESRGRGAKSQIAPNERVKGFICVVTGLRRRAVADADSSDRLWDKIAGTGYGTWLQLGYEP